MKKWHGRPDEDWTARYRYLRDPSVATPQPQFAVSRLGGSR